MGICYFIPMNGQTQMVYNKRELVSDTSDVFLASGLTVDTYTCKVTPFDGVDNGILK